MTGRASATPRRHRFKLGEMARVLYHENPKTRDMWLGKIVVVRAVYGFRVEAQRIIGAMSGIKGEVKWEHMKHITEDDMSERELAAFTAWRLIEGD